MIRLPVMQLINPDKTERTFNPPQQPATQHPRLLGDNTQWQAYYQPFEDLNCVDSANDSDWGAVMNVKNLWDRHTKGGAECRNEKPTAIAEVSDAAFYLNPDDKWNRDRALRILFLLRQLKHCHANGGNNCLYNAADMQSLQDAFLNYEMQRFDSIRWDWGYKYFDLGTEPPMKFWSLLVDIFWDDLSTENKQRIDTKLGEKIDCYLQQVAEKDWSIFNGNNWTPVLGKGAMYWGITYYYEDTRAAQIVKEVLNSLWLHRDFYLEDGAYKEGIVEYTNVYYSNLR